MVVLMCSGLMMHVQVHRATLHLTSPGFAYGVVGARVMRGT